MSLAGTFGAFYGYMAGLLITAYIHDFFRTDLARGMFALTLGAIFAAVGFYVGKAIGDWLHRKLRETKACNIDDALLYPCRIIVSIFIIWVLSQTLIYLPIVSLQYLAQGSTTFILLDKHTPDSFIAHIASRVAPYQFTNRQLEYDQEPLTYKGLGLAGQMKAVARGVAPSVVKVSGRSCPANGRIVNSGSGFVVAPGFVITNAHLVVGQSTIYVRTHDSVFPATPMAIDERHDIAVLYSKFMTTEKPLKFAAAEPPEGSSVLIMGYPGAGNFTVMQTMTVSSKGLSLNQDKTALNEQNSIRLASGLWKGSSGGPIINDKGEVVAVTYASDGIHSLGVDASVAKQLASEAERKPYAKHTGYCKVFKGYN